MSRTYIIYKKKGKNISILLMHIRIMDLKNFFIRSSTRLKYQSCLRLVPQYYLMLFVKQDLCKGKSEIVS